MTDAFLAGHTAFRRESFTLPGWTRPVHPRQLLPKGLRYVAHFIKGADAPVKPGKHLLPPGHTAFRRESFTLPGWTEENDGSLTLWPQRHGTDGFYICKMRKSWE